MRRLLTALGVWAAMTPLAAQEQTSLEYQVKAAYLYNFVKFIEWPDATRQGPLTICIAENNPFGKALDDLVRGESIDGRAIAARVVSAPQPDCHVVFVPRGVAAGEYLRTARNAPVLTVGESADFVAQGGIINFVRDAGMIRFEIDQDAARRAGLQISSRLLRLAREPERRSRG
jgi:uncharacterized protein DUF4154